ncbi:MAG: secondary thiamine-phosphate synthase enzyme YjbQ [Chloroflexota bacterium]
MTVSTQQPIQLLDITAEIEDLLRDARVEDGMVTVFSRHTTAAVRIQEDEPLLMEDFEAFLSDLAPTARSYRHNDFGVRTQHMHPDERPNGHAHCLQLLLGSTESVPVFGGKLQLGAWQRLFLVELDGPRPAREVMVSIFGTAQPAVLHWPTPVARASQRPAMTAVGAR